MKVSLIKQVLFESNLNLNNQIIGEIFTFIQQHKHHISHNEDTNRNLSISQSHILAIAAIIIQSKFLPAQNFMTLGLRIENIMSHLGSKISKQYFLEIISKLVKLNEQMNCKLSSKIAAIRLSFRMFKKFRIVFENLWKYLKISNLVANDLLAIFWIVYLLAKCNNIEKYHDFEYQIQLIKVIIKAVFEYWLGNVEEGVVNEIIEDSFGNRLKKNSQEIQQFFIMHQFKALKQINLIYNSRYKNQIDWNKFSRNPLQISQFLDDLSNQFFEQQNSIFQNEIENYLQEISYLQLRRVRVNQFIKEQQCQISSIIKKVDLSKNSIEQESKRKEKKKQQLQGEKINNHHYQNQLKFLNSYNQSNFIIQQNLPIMTPNHDRQNILTESPCTNRIANLEWINKCVDFYSKHESQIMFQKVFLLNEQINRTYSSYEKWAKQKLLKVVEEFTPKCIKKGHRINQIYQFFKYFVIKIYQNHEPIDNKKMFSALNVFNSILCLSVDMFNYGYSSLYSPYCKLCEQFEISLLQALIPINWIGKKLQKPKQMNDYLYFLQKRIVIREIWEDQTGYNLIKSQENYMSAYKISYTDLIIWGRLQKHILQRVTELCREVKLIDIKLIKRVENLISHLLKQKPDLLYKNKIDQIVICSITSFLKINQISEQKTLENVFNEYNKLDLSSGQNCEGLRGNGVQMSLVEFYNKIFLPEIQQIIMNNDLQIDFLTTPVRRSYRNSSQMTPFTKKHHEIFNYREGINQTKSQDDINIENVNMKKNIFEGFSKKPIIHSSENNELSQSQIMRKIMRRTIVTLNQKNINENQAYEKNEITHEKITLEQNQIKQQKQKDK